MTSKKAVAPLKSKRAKYLSCPYCGHNEFNRIEKRDIVKMRNDKDSITDEVIDELAFPDYQYQCRKCMKNITEDEMGANSNGKKGAK